MPEAELGEHETGVWALAASNDGSTVVTGTDEGAVTAWDLRTRRATWQARRACGVSCMTISSGTAASRAVSGLVSRRFQTAFTRYASSSA